MLYRNEKSSRESDTCGSTGFIENKQRERRDRTEMDQAAGATDQLLLESKSHGTKNAQRERERGYGHEQQGERPRTTLASCACKNNEDHDRPRRAVPCRADEQATWASRAGTARTGFAQIKEGSCCWTRAGQGAGCGAGLRDAEPACSDAAARDAGRSCTTMVNTVRERRPGDRARRIEHYEQQEARAKNRSNLYQNSMIRAQMKFSLVQTYP